MYISIICPVFNEEAYIETCIDSLLVQDYPKEDLEIIFVDGNSTDRTVELIEFYQKDYPFIKILNNPDKIVPISMNMGIEQAKGDYIIRLDAHAYYPSDYFSKLIEKAKEHDTDNIGGNCLTDVLGKTSMSYAIKEVLGNKFGVGDSVFRTGCKDPVETDTVPFGCFKREVFDKHGLYDPRLVRNQDIELNKRIAAGGGKILLIPDTYCVYYAKDTFKKFWKSNYSNGLWSVLTPMYTKKLSSLSFRHFVPLIFLLSLLLPLFSCTLLFELIYIGLASLLAYTFVMTKVSIDVAKSNKDISIPYLIVAFLNLHLSYGLGSLAGIFRAGKIKLGFSN